MEYSNYGKLLTDLETCSHKKPTAKCYVQCNAIPFLGLSIRGGKDPKDIQGFNSGYLWVLGLQQIFIFPCLVFIVPQLSVMSLTF